MSGRSRWIVGKESVDANLGKVLRKAPRTVVVDRVDQNRDSLGFQILYNATREHQGGWIPPIDNRLRAEVFRRHVDRISADESRCILVNTVERSRDEDTQSVLTTGLIGILDDRVIERGDQDSIRRARLFDKIKHAVKKSGRLVGK